MPGMLLSVIAVAFSFLGSCSADLDDWSQLMQRDMQLYDGAQDPDRTFINTPQPSFLELSEFEDDAVPTEPLPKKKHKLPLNPFKNMVSNINIAIDTLKQELEANTHEVVHMAAAELEDAGKQLNGKIQQIFKDVMLAKSADAAASLLEISGESANATKRKVKLEFNPFKDMISQINSAIDTIKDGLETSTRQVIHQAASEMEQTGRQLASDLEQTFHSTMQKEIASALSAEPASLLAIEVAEHHKPKLDVDDAEVEVAKIKRKTKKAFNPFRDMISGINDAIELIKSNLEEETKKLVHEAASDLKDIGEEFAKGIREVQELQIPLVEKPVEKPTTP